MLINLENNSRIWLMSKIEEKWGQDVIDANGYLAVPNVLLYNLHKLDISSTEAVVLLFLLSYWWDKAEVFPATANIAKRLGVTKRTVDRSLKTLSEKELIINKGKKDNGYGATVRHFDLSPVRDRLHDIVNDNRRRALERR